MVLGRAVSGAIAPGTSKSDELTRAESDIARLEEQLETAKGANVDLAAESSDLVSEFAVLALSSPAVLTGLIGLFVKSPTQGG